MDTQRRWKNKGKKRKDEESIDDKKKDEKQEYLEVSVGFENMNEIKGAAIILRLMKRIISK